MLLKFTSRDDCFGPQNGTFLVGFWVVIHSFPNMLYKCLFALHAVTVGKAMFFYGSFSFELVLKCFTGKPQQTYKKPVSAVFDSQHVGLVNVASSRWGFLPEKSAYLRFFFSPSQSGIDAPRLAISQSWDLVLLNFKELCPNSRHLWSSGAVFVFV